MTTFNPEKYRDGGVLLPLTARNASGFGEIAPTDKRGESETMCLLPLCPCDTFVHQVKATGGCELKVGACPSAGLGDRCWVGSMPVARSEKLRCQIKDLLSWEKQAVPTTNGAQDPPALQRRGAGAVFTLPTVGAWLRCHQPLHGTAGSACKGGDRSSLSSV